MNKSELIQTLCKKIQEDLDQIKIAVQVAHEAATSPENKAENEYDTRGLEASYLAGAQAKRGLELQETIQFLRTTTTKDYTNQDVIAHTAVVELESNGKKSVVFLLVKGGGQFITFEGKTIQTVSPHSPLGEALMGQKVGDVVEIEGPQGTREYEILSLQ